MLYNICFEAAAICFLLILNLHIRLQYSAESKQNQLFQDLLVYLIIAVSLDVITAVTISYAAYIPVWLNTILNHAYFVSVLVLEYRFLIYCIVGVCRREPKGAFFRFCQWINILTNILFVINLFTGWVFRFTPEGEYIHGPLYYSFYIVSVFFVIATTGVLLSESRKFSRNQRISIILYSIATLIGPAVQFIFPHVLFSLFTISLGFVMLMFSMETPDYQKLTKTMKELADMRDEAEEAMGLAQAANQAKSDFLSSMSHELRTPINSILGFNEMIMQQTDDPEIKKCTGNVQTAGINLLSLISNILDYTDIEGGRLKINNCSYSTRSMLRDVIAYAEFGTDKAQLELRTDIDENIPSELSGDITRVIQIFNSVISNAVKYTHKGYVEIAVKWIPDEDGISGRISARISDSGMGIRKEDLALLSESFTRLDKKKNQNIQGVGLGLSIVTKLLSLMDGHISIESEYEKGTTVSFELRQQVISSIPAGKISPLGSDDINDDDSYKFFIPDANILTVDDNHMNRELFKGLLRDSGAHIDAACGGKEAIEMLEKNSYSIVFLDHMMPEMDGIETLRVIKDRGLSNAPVIVLTANTVAGAREMYLSEGFDDYLAKPVTGRMLYGALKKFLPGEMIKELPVEIPDKPEEKADLHRKRSVMERLGEFLDTASGMTYCCEDEEFYISILETYIGNSRLEDMKNFFEKKDMDNYRITVHSIKSTSLTIGAAELSAEAKSLEMAQKSGDIAYIEANHQRVYEQYAEMLGRIRAVLEDPDDIGDGGETDGKKNSRIMIVDDDPSCLDIAKRYIEGNFEVMTAASGDEALKILKSNSPDLAVLDIYMPGMDGFELMKRIRELCDVPVVFLTADPDKSLEERCFDEGAMDFITKPVTGTILINRLSRVIELNELKKRVS